MIYLDPLDVPDLNEQRLFLFMRDELGLPVKEGFIHQEIIEREIVPTVIAGKLFFTRRDALEWLERQREKSRIAASMKRRERAKQDLREATEQLAQLDS